MIPKNHLLTSAAALALLATLPSCDEAMLAAMTAPSPSYNQPQPYYGQQPYYRPAPPPSYYGGSYNNYPSGGYYERDQRDPRQASRSDKQSAYDMGYRQGQDDCMRGRGMSAERHKNLYDGATKDSFRAGYISGYDRAKAHRRR